MPTALDRRSRAADTSWARIAGRPTRRGFLGGGAAAGLGIALVGCGSAAAPGAAASGAAATPSTRTVDTPLGKVRVPASPKQIVAINPIPMSTLYDLGIPVAGVYDEGAEYVSPRYLPRYKKAAKVGTAGEVNLEQVAALNPDLVIGADVTFNSSLYKQLSKLAPTVLVPVDGTWQQTAASTAAAVGRTGSLAAFKQQLAKRSAAIKAGYADVLAAYQWDILQGGFDQGDFWLYGPGSPVGQILAGAGVTFAAASAGVSGDNTRTVSYEEISVLSSAGVIGFYSGYDNKPTNEGPQLFAQPGFKTLAAVRASRLVPFPDFLPGGYGDALAVLSELETGLKNLQKENA